MKLVSPETTLSITLSARESNINIESITKMAPTMVLTMPINGLPPILALITLSKFSLISPPISSE